MLYLDQFSNRFLISNVEINYFYWFFPTVYSNKSLLVLYNLGLRVQKPVVMGSCFSIFSIPYITHGQRPVACYQYDYIKAHLKRINKWKTTRRCSTKVIIIYSATNIILLIVLTMIPYINQNAKRFHGPIYFDNWFCFYFDVLFVYFEN